MKRFGKLFADDLKREGRGGGSSRGIQRGASREISSTFVAFVYVYVSKANEREKEFDCDDTFERGRGGGGGRKKEKGEKGGRGREGKARSTRPWTPPQVE